MRSSSGGNILLCHDTTLGSVDSAGDGGNGERSKVMVVVEMNDSGGFVDTVRIADQAQPHRALKHSFSTSASEMVSHLRSFSICRSSPA